MTLVGATVASVWGDIFHHPDDETVLDDTLACVRWMYSEWDGLSGWMGIRKVRPRICLWSGMQFPVEGSGGKCDPEFAIRVGCSFPTEPQAETASHSGREFRDKLSAMQKRPQDVAFDLYMFSGYPYDKPRSNNMASVRAEAYKVHREFRTQRGPLMWPPSCAGLSEQGTLYASARTDVSVMNSQLAAI